MDKRLMYLCALLGIVCAFAAGLDVILWNTNRQQDTQIKLDRTRIDAIAAARIAEKRSTIISQYTQCVGAIKTLKIANTVIQTQKDLLLDLAKTNAQRAKIDTGEARALDLQSAAQRRQKAKTLILFPPLTKKKCMAIRDAALAKVEPSPSVSPTTTKES